MNQRIVCGLFSAAALALGACAPDPHDVYTVQAPPATRAPLPTTLPPPESVDEAGNPAVETAIEEVTFAATGEVVEVRSLDNTFREQQQTIVAGTEIRWINGGRNEHNVLPVDEIVDMAGAAGFGIDRDAFLPGEEYSYVFDTPGVYPYFCSIHGNQVAGMVGTIIVEFPTG